jgi:uncharacterized repeat protein (TIGR01451 family)
VRHKTAEVWLDSPRFRAICGALLAAGSSVRFRARGLSMQPNILDGDIVIVSPAALKDVRIGEVVFTDSHEGFRLHRVVATDRLAGNIITRGDSGIECDVPAAEVLGRVVEIERDREKIRFSGRTRVLAQKLRRVMRESKLAVRNRVKRLGVISAAMLMVCGAFGLAIPAARAQSADLSMTQTASPTTVARGSNITYTEVVTNNGPNSAVTATLFQQVPANTTFTSITIPTGWTCTTPAAGGTGSINCTDGSNLASGATATFTIVVTVPSTTAAGTQITNSADTTSTTSDPSGTNNATLTTVNVEISNNADLAISATASPSPVYLSSTLTYTLLVQNLGLANVANNATVTDTLPGAVTYVSAVASQGSCSQAAGTVTCPLGALASGATASVTITVTAPSTAQSISNTASVSGSVIDPTDPVASNNSVTTTSLVQQSTCGTPGANGAGGTLTGVINTYYPPRNIGTNVAVGAKSINLNNPTGNTAVGIAIGDRLLIMQMQSALLANAGSATNSNTSAYGDGVNGDPGSGSSSYQSTGKFEYVTATSALGAGNRGTINFSGTGPGGGTLYAYQSSNYSSGANGQQTYQVIRVPQYTTATLSSGLTTLAWNGSTGGVLAFDVSQQLTLGGTVSVDGLGFRGGAGVSLGGGSGASTDYVTLASNAANGSKGEGIAGSPENMSNATLTGITNNSGSNEGYPQGSYARGAPGNAGGGGTDGNPSANDQNTGGGGGANGGAGGQGGYSWNTSSNSGGFGGVAYPANAFAVVMGGGGGAGTTNNGTSDPNTNTTGINSSGAAGGGIVLITAGLVSGAGTITANGQTALNVANDGGGGGGAGGSIILIANSGSLSGLTVSAAGGTGGSTWLSQTPGTYPGNRHGPGGGGGGGVIILTGAAGTASVAGGNNGVSTTALDAFGATPGSAGILITNAATGAVPGPQTGASCTTADLGVTNSGSPNVVTPGSNITYTQSVINNGPNTAINATFSQAVPANTTFQSITTPTGWTCTTPAVGATGNVVCTDPLIANGATANFTFVVKVNPGTTDQTQITDTDSVTSGTDDPTLSNNSASVTTVVSLVTGADLVITNSATPNPVAAGSNISYTQVVRNNGPATASTLTFTETLPASTTFVSMATPSGWSCSTPAAGATGTITCTIASLASGGTATFSPVLKVTAGTSSGTQISDTASIAAVTPDPNPTSNDATAVVTVATGTQADLALTTSASPNPVLPGNNVTFTQSVTNNGPAASLVNTFTETIPANTTFVSLTQPSGWTCTTPAVGATGTITCTDASFASGATSSFPLVVKVNSTASAGTVISNNPSVSATGTSDPTSTNNSASASTVVASSAQADVSITKTAAPEPVDQNTNLVYTLTVSNNGPAAALNVTVSDPLPAQVTYTSASSTQGTCAQAGGTVTCSVGTMGPGSVAVVTINVNATTFSSSAAGLASNTATVTTTSSDPNPANNSSTATSTIQAPTAVQLVSLRAMPQTDGTVVVEWKTREEVRNLGFNVYRVSTGARTRLNPSLIAGAALILRNGKPQHAAKTYQWIDTNPIPGSSYELEDVDLGGTRMPHGPVQMESSTAVSKPVTAQTTLLSHMNRTAASISATSNRVKTRPFRGFAPPVTIRETSVTPENLDGEAAVKISVDHEGWYRVSRAQLIAAGLEANANAHTLQLFAEGVEIPILILGSQAGPLGPNDAIEFYGTGIDTPFSDTRVYWLISGHQAGRRILLERAYAGNTPVEAFPEVAVREDRTTYFAALLNGENQDNFFGDIVTNEPVDQAIDTAHVAPSALPSSVEVTLQGVTDAQAHDVSVAFNGTYLGNISFADQANFHSSFPLSPASILEGANTVTLTALDGDNDVSLVQSIVLHYTKSFIADNDTLRMQAAEGSEIHAAGFSNAKIRIFDITNQESVSELQGMIKQENGAFSVDFGVPGSAVAGSSSRTLLAFADGQAELPSVLNFHPRSNLTQQGLTQHGHGSSIVVIAHPDFMASLAPLVQLREQQGYSVKVVTTEQLFDAFNFGERSPFAIRDYLRQLSVSRRQAPQFVLLAGDASLDPRNYLGFGKFDFVPTRLIDTAALKTASDDWFSDFTESGYGTIPTGRLPVRTPADADLLIGKIVGYESGRNSGAWTSQALVVADQDNGANFSSTAGTVAKTLSPVFATSTIASGNTDPAVVKQQIVEAINAGTGIVNFTGHGSVEQWSFVDLFDDNDAAALQNGGKLPVFFIMNCLNGFFQDVYTQSLAESLMLAPNGGAVAVWASSGFTDAPPQAGQDLALARLLAADRKMPLGLLVQQAKATTTDPDVRRTWILFGDPAMKIQATTPAPALLARPPAAPRTGAAALRRIPND